MSEGSNVGTRDHEMQVGVYEMSFVHADDYLGHASQQFGEDATWRVGLR